MAGKEEQAEQTVSDPEIPGGVYLCQVSETVSCGACCGLYNVADLSRQGLHYLLARRTRRFYGMAGRDIDAVLSFRKWVEDSEPQQRPLAEFHHCPYIGLIGSDLSRPGCLLHPLGNSGIDMRGISDYGGFACRSYFCPTHHILSAEIKMLIRNAARDWFEYGLLINETALVKAFVDAAGSKAFCRRGPDSGPCPNPEHRLHMMRELMDLKRSWPFRSDPAGGLIHYFFNDGLYARAPVNYAAIGAATSPYDRIFQELGSSFGSIDALRTAEAVMENMLTRKAL